MTQIDTERTEKLQRVEFEIFRNQTLLMFCQKTSIKKHFQSIIISLKGL